MPTPQRRLSGDDAATEQLWFAYFSAATKPLLEINSGWMPEATKTGRHEKFTPDREILASVQSLIFSALTLEYRMKRALEVLGVKLRKNTSLGDLVSCFWSRVGDSQKLKKEGKCAAPAAWEALKPKLISLVTWRNDIAHVRFSGLRRLLGAAPLETAKDVYNDVVEAIKLINIGIGYVSEGSDPESYFDALKLR